MLTARPFFPVGRYKMSADVVQLDLPGITVLGRNCCSHAYTKVVQAGHIELLAAWVRPAGGLLQDTPYTFNRSVIVVAWILGE